MRKYAENAENLSRASPIVGNLESPSNFTNGGFGRHRRQLRDRTSDSIVAL
jgi:hypothetical protein